MISNLTLKRLTYPWTPIMGSRFSIADKTALTFPNSDLATHIIDIALITENEYVLMISIKPPEIISIRLIKFI